MPLTDLMGYMDEAKWNTHETDDATQKYLVDFFNSISNEPGFQELYDSLTDAERTKLHKMNEQKNQLPQIIQSPIQSPHLK